MLPDAFMEHGGALVIVLPMLGSLCCFLWPRRAVALGLCFSLVTVWLVLELVWMLLPTAGERYSIGGWGAPLGIDLVLDSLSLLMLLLTAAIALPLAVYARAYFTDHAPEQIAAFWALWLMLWSALNALFQSGDVFNLYVTLELSGFAAVSLVGLSKGKQALAGALRYLLVSLVGSMLYLLGVALLYHRYGVLDISLLSQQLHPGLESGIFLSLMVAGLVMKSALFPLHFWLPPAHGSAPAPVSALLSALVVKAAFYLLVRLWLTVFGPLDTFGVAQLLGVLGSIAIIWGSLQALRQQRLKLLIAYSTVAQMGYLFLGFALNTAWSGVIVFAIAHALAKAAMFLAAGNLLRLLQHDRIAELDRTAVRLPITVAGFSMAGVSIMGLPPSGGFAGKWMMLEVAINQSHWWIAAAIVLGSVLAGAYIFKVLGHAFTHSAQPLLPDRIIPASMEWSVFALGLSALLLGLFTMPLIGWLDVEGLLTPVRGYP